MEELKYHYKYPHPAVTTDCVVFGYDGERLNVLLIERGGEPFKGSWAFPGGFLEMDEAAEEGAKRELFEETGLRISDLRQFHTFSTPNRDPRDRVISIAYYALVSIMEVKGSDDAAQAQWFPLNEVPPLAFDHDLFLRLAKMELCKQIHFAPIGLGLLPEPFTIFQLQRLYEAVSGLPVDRQLLTDNMRSLGLLELCEEGLSPDDKSAVRYHFNTERYHVLKENGFPQLLLLRKQ